MSDVWKIRTYLSLCISTWPWQGVRWSASRTEKMVRVKVLQQPFPIVTWGLQNTTSQRVLRQAIIKAGETCGGSLVLESNSGGVEVWTEAESLGQLLGNCQTPWATYFGTRDAFTTAIPCWSPVFTHHRPFLSSQFYIPPRAPTQSGCDFVAGRVSPFHDRAHHLDCPLRHNIRTSQLLWPPLDLCRAYHGS